jgi:hypothetical protein
VNPFVGGVGLSRLGFENLTHREGRLHDGRCPSVSVDLHDFARGRVFRGRTVVAELKRTDNGWWATLRVGLTTTVGPAPLEELLARISELLEDPVIPQ